MKPVLSCMLTYIGVLFEIPRPTKSACLDEMDRFVAALRSALCEHASKTFRNGLYVTLQTRSEYVPGVAFSPMLERCLLQRSWWTMAEREAGAVRSGASWLG